MADYDVGVLVLSSPPPSSVLTPYRPAVSVRNNGIHDALASGTLRIYAADRLIFTTELYSATIPTRETRDALGTDYWTPPSEGKFLVIADITCPLDQVESNNHLSPTTITVSGGPPPPPTTVAPHGSQHEDGGADEVNIDGLHGRLADAQPALAHKASHMVGGADAMSVEGLPGQLLEAQGIRDHAQSHEALGTDRLNVDGLHGQLYNVQKADVHDNSAHDPNYSINKHGAVDHNADVEAVSRKGVASGYAGLGANAYVPANQLGLFIQGVLDTDALRKDQSYGPVTPLAHKTSHQNGESDEINVAGLSGQLADPQISSVLSGVVGEHILRGDALEQQILGTIIPSGALARNPGFIIDLYGTLSTVIKVGQTLAFKLIAGANTIATIVIPCANVMSSNWHLRCYIWRQTGNIKGYAALSLENPIAGSSYVPQANVTGVYPWQTSDLLLAVDALWTAGLVGSVLTSTAGRFYCTNGD